MSRLLPRSSAIDPIRLPPASPHRYGGSEMAVSHLHPQTTASRRMDVGGPEPAAITVSTCGLPQVGRPRHRPWRARWHWMRRTRPGRHTWRPKHPDNAVMSWSRTGIEVIGLCRQGLSRRLRDVTRERSRRTRRHRAPPPDPSPRPSRRTHRAHPLGSCPANHPAADHQ